MLSLATVKAALASSKTPASLKRGLIKKYGSKLGKVSMSALATTVHANPKMYGRKERKSYKTRAKKLDEQLLTQMKRKGDRTFPLPKEGNIGGARLGEKKFWLGQFKDIKGPSRTKKLWHNPIYIKGKKVKSGDRVKDFRGETWTVTDPPGEAPHHAGSTGRINVKKGKWSQQFFPSVFGGKWRDNPARKMRSVGRGKMTKKDKATLQKYVNAVYANMSRLGMGMTFVEMGHAAKKMTKSVHDARLIQDNWMEFMQMCRKEGEKRGWSSYRRS